MYPFIISETKNLLGYKASDAAIVFEYFKKEFKKKANPDKMIIKNNLLVIKNDFPYRKSMRLINGIDRLEIIYHKDGKIEYKIYIIGFHVITLALILGVGIGFGSIFAGFFIFLLMYINVLIAVKTHKNFIRKKIEELKQLRIGKGMEI
jgi:hypothetical protein